MEDLQVNRYAKQILFRPIGEQGQAKISASMVTIIGLGALGTVSSNQLSRSGVGHLKLVDRDFLLSTAIFSVKSSLMKKMLWNSCQKL